MKFAPVTPTTLRLESMHPINAEVLSQVAHNRELVARNFADGFVGFVGACTLMDDPMTLSDEVDRLQQIDEANAGLSLGPRMCPWKPRSDLNEPFWGIETVQPVAAYRLFVEQAKARAKIAMDMGHIDHLHRYGKFLSFAWIGARKSDDVELIEAIALEEPGLSLGVKNGTDGEIDATIALVNRLNRLRGLGAAPVLLVYRGGENARTPEAWEREYKRALNLTDGQVVLDSSHGSGRAHDPKGEFDRTSDGQEVCLEHAVDLAHKGFVPAGALIEASAMERVIDPHAPFEIGVSAAVELYKERLKQLHR